LEPSASALSLILDSAVDTAIIALDTQGLVRLWSAGAQKLLGWTAIEMTGQSLERIFPEDGQPRDRLAEEMHDARTHGRGGHEGWRVRKDGSRFWAVGEMTPVSGAGAGNITFVKVLRDRTEQMLAEQALENERHVLAVLNRASTALARETSVDALVQAVIDAGVELTGAGFGAFIYNTLDGRNGNYPLYALSGVSPEMFGRYAMMRNTEVFASTPEGTGIVRSGNIKTDPRYSQYTHNRTESPAPFDVTSYLAVPVVARGGYVRGGLFFGHPEPDVFTERAEHPVMALAAEAAIAIDNARLFEETQRLNATLEQQVAERTEQLHRQEDALRQAQKMEAVGQLTGGIAHDFNNLLQGIVGGLDLIAARIEQGRTNDLSRFITGAMTSANRASALTHRLLAFSRRQPLDPKPVRVNPLVQSMEDLLRRTLGEHITVQLDLDDHLWLTLCDENQLESAILNLVINARDAMPDGGELTITTRNSTLVADAAGHDVPSGEFICIAVTDTGVGMSPATIDRAFEPFYTTKPMGQGTGLGLSMIYGFVRQSEGVARIVSELGQGTTIHLYLPRHLIDAPVVESPEAGGLHHHGDSGKVVLVVEDEPVVRSLVVDVLDELGYTTLEAGDGQAGLDLLQSQQHIDLLITDIGLPLINGRQMADAAMASRANLKVLFMTGYAENAAAPGGFLGPNMQMITKPFAFERLASRVRQMLAD
jgi:PAS domain S-box-containing protein